jgi:hypothetical protein
MNGSHISETIQTKFGIQFQNATGNDVGGSVFLSHAWAAVGQICIEATFMDRLKQNLA